MFVLGWGFWGRRIERRHFRLAQIQDGGHLEKLQMAKSLKCIIPFTVCMLDLEAKARASGSERETGRVRASEIFPVSERQYIQVSRS